MTILSKNISNKQWYLDILTILSLAPLIVAIPVASLIAAVALQKAFAPLILSISVAPLRAFAPLIVVIEMAFAPVIVLMWEMAFAPVMAPVIVLILSLPFLDFPRLSGVVQPYQARERRTVCL